MANPTFAVAYSGGTELRIEGFGPDTIVGAVSDILNGHYEPPEGQSVTKITVIPEDSAPGVSVSALPEGLHASAPKPVADPARFGSRRPVRDVPQA